MWNRGAEKLPHFPTPRHGVMFWVCSRRSPGREGAPVGRGGPRVPVGVLRRVVVSVGLSPDKDFHLPARPLCGVPVRGLSPIGFAVQEGAGPAPGSGAPAGLPFEGSVPWDPSFRGPLFFLSFVGFIALWGARFS